MKIIGLTGRKRHGKNEVGNAICQFMPGAVTVGFADKLKISMMRSLGFNDRSEAELIELADTLKEDAHFQLTYKEPNSPLKFSFHEFSARQLLQWYGTEGGRKTFGDSFWIDQVLPEPNGYATQLSDKYGNAPLLVITDIRFDNEAHRVLAHGGEVWKVVRPGYNPDDDKHESEKGVSIHLVDRTVLNDDTLDHLTWKVECALELAGMIDP